MLKDLLKERNISVYKLSAAIKEPYSSINDIVNRKVDIIDCKVGVFLKIADYLNLSLQELYEITHIDIHVFSQRYNTTAFVYVSGKKYHFRYSYHGLDFDVEQCKVTDNTTLFLEDIILMEMEKRITQQELEERICSI